MENIMCIQGKVQNYITIILHLSLVSYQTVLNNTTHFLRLENGGLVDDWRGIPRKNDCATFADIQIHKILSKHWETRLKTLCKSTGSTIDFLLLMSLCQCSQVIKSCDLIGKL